MPRKKKAETKKTTKRKATKKKEVVNKEQDFLKDETFIKEENVWFSETPVKWVYSYKATNQPMQVIRSLARKTNLLDELVSICPKKHTTYELKEKIYGKDPMRFLANLYSESSNPDVLFIKLKEGTIETVRDYYDDILSIALGLNEVNNQMNRDIVITLALNVACSDGILELTISGSRNSLGNF